MGEMKPIIEIIAGQMRSQVDDGIYKVVQEYGINVDKERLLQALKDAKEFWHEGYKDGYRAAVWERPRWISVEERLPEIEMHGTSRVVLAWEPEHGRCFGMVYDNGQGKRWFSGGVEIPNITHWMPLPEPPEVEG